ncbi:MAG: hypothetical protein JNL25_14240 [Rhodospirillaceae bacterium]|nr:hypothetical protein [Rhodospirillaceae bacterium]
MFMPSNYDDTLREMAFGRRAVGSAWGLVATLTVALIAISTLVFVI